MSVRHKTTHIKYCKLYAWLYKESNREVCVKNAPNPNSWKTILALSHVGVLSLKYAQSIHAYLCPIKSMTSTFGIHVMNK